MRWRRTPCDHSTLLAEIETLRAENARLRVQLVTAQMLGWMHSAIVSRDRHTARHRRAVCDSPTQIIGRHR